MNPARFHIRPAARTVLAAVVLASSANSAPILENGFNFNRYGPVAGGGTATDVGNTAVLPGGLGFWACSAAVANRSAQR